MSPQLEATPRTREQAACDIATKAQADVHRLRDRDPTSAAHIAIGALDRIAELLKAAGSAT